MLARRARTVVATGLKLGTELGFNPEKVIVNIRATCHFIDCHLDERQFDDATHRRSTLLFSRPGINPGLKCVTIRGQGIDPGLTIRGQRAVVVWSKVLHS